MTFEEEVGYLLEKIRAIGGVEQVLLTQRDGNPIQYTGLWLAYDEVFTLASATSAIYNLGLKIHGKMLKYILLEGRGTKILIAPLVTDPNDPVDRIMEKQGIPNYNDEYFIAITARGSANLGGIFLKTRETLKNIKRALILSGRSFKPPLRKFTEDEVKELLARLNIKEGTSTDSTVITGNIYYPRNILKKIEGLLRTLSVHIPSVEYAYITTAGGFLISTFIPEPKSKPPAIEEIGLEYEAAMSYSLYSTANRCAWLLKKIKINSIILECRDCFHIISELDDGIFGIKIGREGYKLGLIRLLIPRYIPMLEKLVTCGKRLEKPFSIANIGEIIGEILLK